MVRGNGRRAARWTAVGLYVALVAFALFSPLAPRVFWTMAMPVLPLAIVLFGVYRWRGACPVAAIGTVGAALAPKRAHKRIPRWLRDHGMSVSMGVLVLSLTLRHVATNGDHLALGLFLIALPIVAVAVNARFGGRAFCQYVCPVGVVERIYTDGAPPVATADAEPSTCSTCSACTKPCIDIDRERSFDRTSGRVSRRIVTYAFPGIVFGFYAYYALREGSWEAYFGGAWTRYQLSVEHVVGQGLFFAEVPAVVAALAVLVGLGALSYALFAALEARGLDRERVLASAAFTAFATFYFFAGAPSLRLVPALERSLAFIVPCVATAVFLHRTHRHWATAEVRSAPTSAPSRRRLPIIED